MKNLDFGHRCNCNGKELRNTHYILGKDRKSTIPKLTPIIFFLYYYIKQNGT